MKYLMFNLSGPLQAWGSPLPGMYRTINNHPTKSGIVGLIGAALGIPRVADDLLKELGDKITMACRIDAPGRKIHDFHVVQNTFLRYSAQPTSKRKLQNILSLRDYLCNAVFTLCLQGEDVDKWYEAMQHPKYVLFLGRKSCLPNYMFPKVIEAENIHEAFNSYNIAELYPCLIPALSKDAMLKVFWEGSDQSIPPIHQHWKYDKPNGHQKFGQRLEFSGYLERVA